MDRRNFLKGIGALVAGVALDQAVPLGRVYSFPSELKCLNAGSIVRTDFYRSTVDGSTFEFVGSLTPSSDILKYPDYDPVAVMEWARNITFVSTRSMRLPPTDAPARIRI